MKKLYFKLLSIIFIAAAISFVSCSKDDDSVSNIEGDYIEVTINGKTYRHSVLGIYATWPTDIDGVLCYYSTEETFDSDGFDVFYGLYCYEDIDRLLRCSTGSYDIVTTNENFREAENLSFILDYANDENYYEIKSGSHRVTSIKPTKVKTLNGSSDAVQVEGTFDLIMTAENYTSDKQCKISGKYRMSIW